MGKAALTPVPGEVAQISDETLRLFAGYHMKRAWNVVQADVTRVLKPFKLRMVTYSALVLIVDNPGLRQAQLADALAIERPNLVVIVDELEARDLILRDRDPSDRRAYALVPTLTGRRLCARAVAAVQEHEKRIFGFLDATHRDDFLRALRQVEKPV